MKQAKRSSSLSERNGKRFDRDVVLRVSDILEDIDMKKSNYALGSLLLGAVSWLCLLGLQHIERRMKSKNRKVKKAALKKRQLSLLPTSHTALDGIHASLQFDHISHCADNRIDYCMQMWQSSKNSHTYCSASLDHVFCNYDIFPCTRTKAILSATFLLSFL